MATTLRETLTGLLGPDFQTASGRVVGTASPADEPELAAVMAAATAAGVPIVPRGSGSSPYGGAIAESGLVLTFEHLDRIVKVDAERLLVALEPGVLWQDLMDHLARLGLAPRVYPSSRAFATVGGFVAQGGAGVGSYEFGRIDYSVDSVRILDAAGQARWLSGPDLELVIGAEGRTGLLAQLQLRLQPAPNIAPVIGLFDVSNGIEAALSAAHDLALPLWSVSFIDPIAGGAHSDHGGARRPLLPVGRYAVLFLCRLDDANHVDELAHLIRAAGGIVGEEQSTTDRWVDRFMGLQVLRTTPLPLQFRLPAGELASVVEALEGGARSELGFEGVAIDGGREIVVRFLFPNRTLSSAQNLDVAGQLLQLVKRAGGAPYATGAFFLDEAARIYGAERLQRLQRFRAEQDPNGLLNPGRAFPD